MQIFNCIGAGASNTLSVQESFDPAQSSLYDSSNITYILLIFILNLPLGGFGHLAILNACLQTRSMDDGELFRGVLNILMCWKQDHEDIFLFSWWVILYTVFLRYVQSGPGCVFYRHSWQSDRRWTFQSLFRRV